MTTPARVVVVGGGFAGLYASIYLARADMPEDAVQVTLVSDNNYFTFTPLLAEVVAGSLGRDDVVIPIRALAAKSGFDFLRARVEGVDPERGCVHTSTGDVAFDYLVIALGSGPEYFGNESLARASVPFVTANDAMVIRNRILATAERAAQERSATKRQDLLRFAVAGAGPSGIEVGSEIHGFLGRVLPRYFGVRESPVVSVYQRSDRILPGWDPALAEEGLDVLRARGLNVHLGTSVDSFDDNVLETSTREGGTQSAPVHMLIWTAGTAPATDVIDDERLPRGPREHLLVDRYLRVKGHENIYAVGDVAQVPRREDGEFQPAVAPIAISAGVRAAGNIENTLMGRTLEPYEAHHAGKIVSLGSGTALVDLLGWRIRGWPAWWMYRTIYLLKLVGTKNKLRALTSLTLNRIFEPPLECDC